MTPRNDFGRSLAFAALAGLGAFAVALLAPHPAAALPWLRLYLVGCAVLYVASLARRPRAALGAAAAAAGGGVLLLGLPLGLAGTALGAAGLVAAVRSGLLFRARPLRAALCEAALAVGGLGLAAFLLDGRLGLALGVWGYFLVQSVFFLIGGMAPRRAAGPEDPFDRARAELLALLR